MCVISFRCPSQNVGLARGFSWLCWLLSTNGLLRNNAPDDMPFFCLIEFLSLLDFQIIIDPVLNAIWWIQVQARPPISLNFLEVLFHYIRKSGNIVLIPPSKQGLRKARAKREFLRNQENNRAKSIKTSGKAQISTKTEESWQATRTRGWLKSRQTNATQAPKIGASHTQELNTQSKTQR